MTAPRNDAAAETVRSFVALPLPERQRAALTPYLAACAAAAPGFRWVPPENLHLTLRFLGNRPAGLLEDLHGRLLHLAARPFEIGLDGLGSFGGRRARVVWLGLAAGATEAGALSAAIEAACRQAGVEPEERPFRPHLTLARARDRAGGELPPLPPPIPLPAWTADSFVLVRSRLGAGPARYEELRRYALSERRRPHRIPAK